MVQAVLNYVRIKTRTDWLSDIDDFVVEIGGRDCVHLDGEG
jgi:hypothetical protein